MTATTDPPIPQGTGREVLRVLILEDNPADAELMVHELRRTGYEIDSRRVETENDFRSALTETPDIILSDFAVPGFDGLRAFGAVRELGLDMPFIIVSGTIGEEQAVEAMQHGVSDYILKDRLTRLGAAVASALKRRSLATEARHQETALEDSEERYRYLFEAANDIIFTHDLSGVFTSLNSTAELVSGYSREESLGRIRVVDLLTPESGALATELTLAKLRGEDVGPFEVDMVTRDGRHIPLEVNSRILRDDDDDGRPVGVHGIARDITARREAETARKEAEEELRDSFARLRQGDAERRKLLARLTQAQEEERQRIAGDIHDDSVQVMTAVGLRLQTLRRHIQDPEALERLTTLQGTVELATARLRHLLFELRPRALDTDGLEAALDIYLEHACIDSGLDYEIGSRLEAEPPTETRVVLFRIAQEALTNIRKHASASTVRVLLEERDGGYHVAIADNGVGFDPAAADETPDTPGHMGLASMRERADRHRGWWRITSTLGVGTTVEFWIPPIDVEEVEPPAIDAAVNGSVGSTVGNNGKTQSRQKTG